MFEKQKITVLRTGKNHIRNIAGSDFQIQMGFCQFDIAVVFVMIVVNVDMYAGIGAAVFYCGSYMIRGCDYIHIYRQNYYSIINGACIYNF